VGQREQRLFAVGRHTHALHILRGLQQHLKAVCDDAVVVHQQNTDGRRAHAFAGMGAGTRTVAKVPPSGDVSISKVPPSARARSVMFIRPMPGRGPGAKPLPLSCTISTRWSLLRYI